MNRIAIVTIALSFLLISFIKPTRSNGKVKTDVEKDGLHGKVKRFITYEYWTHDSVDVNFNTKDVYFSVCHKYNKIGSKIQDSGYGPDSLHNYNEIFEFDDKGNTIEEDAQNGQRNWIVVTRDKIEEDTRNGQGKWFRVASNKYDENNKKIERDEYEGVDTAIEFVYKYSYDENGNMIEERQLSPQGGEYWRHTFKYDNKGNKIEMDCHAQKYIKSGFVDNVHTIYYFAYDERGNMIQDDNIQTKDSSLYERYNYKYYEFDKYGNWTRQLRYVTGYSYVHQLEKVTIRKIEYY